MIFNKLVLHFCTVASCLRAMWWWLCEGGGSQMFGQATHLKISTKVRADMHPRSCETARCVLAFFSILFF